MGAECSTTTHAGVAGARDQTRVPSASMSRVALLLLAAGACNPIREIIGNEPTPGDDTPPPPQWYWTVVGHGVTDVPLTDVWGRSDGAVVAVGWYGTIITNIAPPNTDPVWRQMA